MRRFIVVLLVCVMLCSCSESSEELYVEGFLTISGNGLSAYPFSVESDLLLEFDDNLAVTWTALPVRLSGYGVGDVYHVSSITKISCEGPYYEIITRGYQERFEDLWCLVYDRLNSIDKTDEYINGVVLQDILELVYQDESYDNLRDIVTDCLMLVKRVNDGEVGDEINTEAGILYNQFYAWLRQFSIEDFQEK